ncbi:MAG TPA: hypothetical protein VLT90_16465 [Terriglobales bacterium]|nr:hypothetical protein [Terriglobales bacterium]
MSKYVVLAFFLLTMTGSTLGQNWTQECSYTFTTGNGQNYLQSCVTVNGNVTHFESPSGSEDIGSPPWNRGEGYAFCETSGSPTPYYDFAGFGDSGNWQAPVLLHSTATSVQIARTSSNNIWTLKQTFTQNAGTANLKVVMSVKNNSAVSRNIRFMRWVAASANNDHFHNTFTSSFTSVFAWAGFGLVMQNVPPWTDLAGGYVQWTPVGPDPCNPFQYVVKNMDLPLVNSTGSMYLYYLMTIPPKASRSIALTYKAM